jgi:hypothetical protein
LSPDQFLTRHAEQWQVLRRDPMWRDLIETIRTFDPCRAMPAVTAKDATENTQHLLGRIAGFNLAVNVITALEPGPQHVNLQATYQPEETTDA